MILDYEVTPGFVVRSVLGMAFLGDFRPMKGIRSSSTRDLPCFPTCTLESVRKRRPLPVEYKHRLKGFARPNRGGPSKPTTMQKPQASIEYEYEPRFGE